MLEQRASTNSRDEAKTSPRLVKSTAGAGLRRSRDWIVSLRSRRACVGEVWCLNQSLNACFTAGFILTCAVAQHQDSFRGSLQVRREDTCPSKRQNQSIHPRVYSFQAACCCCHDELVVLLLMLPSGERGFASNAKQLSTSFSAPLLNDTAPLSPAALAQRPPSNHRNHPDHPSSNRTNPSLLLPPKP